MRPLLDDDGDHITALRRVEARVGTHHAEVGIAVLEVIPAHDFEVRRDTVGIIDVAGLEERQEIHFRRFHQANQTARRINLIANEIDLLDARLLALGNREHHVDLAIRQIDGADSDFRGGAPRPTIDFVEAGDVHLRHLGVEGAVRLGADFGLKRLGLDLAVALERNAIDHVAFRHVHDNIGTAAARADAGEAARIAQRLDALLDFGGARSRKIGADHFGVAAAVADDNDLREGRGLDGDDRGDDRKEERQALQNANHGLHVNLVLVATFAAPGRGAGYSLAVEGKAAPLPTDPLKPFYKV